MKGLPLHVSKQQPEEAVTCLVTGTSDRHYGLPSDIQALVTGTMACLVTGTSDRHYGLPSDIQVLVTGTMACLVTYRH